MIEIYTLGYKGKSNASYGAVMKYIKPNKEVEEFESSGVLGDYTKNQADVISIVMALRCVRSTHRQIEVVLHTPPGYASQVVDRNVDGKWKANPRANIEVVNESRSFIEGFDNIKIKPVPHNKNHDKCIELAKSCLEEK